MIVSGHMQLEHCRGTVTRVPRLAATQHLRIWPRPDPGLPFPPFSQAIRPVLTTTISVLLQGSPENASETPLSTLASYAMFNFAESNGRTAALEAINVMAVVAARSAPGLPLARILKIDSGESCSL